MATAHIDYVLAFAAGLGIGGFYFAGLWWTVRLLPRVRHTPAWLAGSFIFRAGLSLLGFYGVLQGGWPMLAASLGGFIMVRLTVVYRMRPAPATALSEQDG
ncbi:MAG: ATP synthase subunit I [Thermodesulfobacteriota bacterium]